MSQPDPIGRFAAEGGAGVIIRHDPDVGVERGQVVADGTHDDGLGGSVAAGVARHPLVGGTGQRRRTQ